MSRKKGSIPWNKGLHTGLVPKTAFKKGQVSPRKGKKASPLSSDHRKAISEGVKNNLPSTAWVKGQHFSLKTEFKKGQFEGVNNPNWKGDKVGYYSLHNWLYRKLGKPMKCELCGIKGNKRYNWANISLLYKRDLEDWIRLCLKCHKAFDRNRKQMVFDTNTGRRIGLY